INGEELVAGTFAEFGVNLSDALGLSTTACDTFAQTVWESRSSQSFTSNPEDIAIQNTTISNCGEIKIIKHTDPRGNDQDFGFTTNVPSAGAGAATFSKAPDTTGATTTFTLNDKGNSNADSANNTEDITNVQPGSYTVTEG